MKFIKSPKFVWGIAILVYIVIGYLYVTGIYASKAKKLRDLERDIRRERNRVAQLTIEVKDYDKIMAEKDSLLALWEEARKHLPSTPRQDEWLKEIAGMAMSCGIEIQSYKPASPKQYELYKDYPIKISVNSGYHDLGTFISLISNADRLMKVQNLTIKNKPSEDDPTQTVQAIFEISNYVYSPAPAPVTEKDKRAVGSNRRRRR